MPVQDRFYRSTQDTGDPATQYRPDDWSTWYQGKNGVYNTNPSDPAHGKSYVTGPDGNRSYISSYAAAQAAKERSGIVRSWEFNPDTGEYEPHTNWGNLLGLAAGATALYNMGAANLGALGAGGGAAGATTGGAGGLSGLAPASYVVPSAALGPGGGLAGLGAVGAAGAGAAGGAAGGGAGAAGGGAAGVGAGGAGAAGGAGGGGAAGTLGAGRALTTIPTMSSTPLAGATVAPAAGGGGAAGTLGAGRPLTTIPTMSSNPLAGRTVIPGTGGGIFSNFLRTLTSPTTLGAAANLVGAYMQQRGAQNATEAQIQAQRDALGVANQQYAQNMGLNIGQANQKVNAYNQVVAAMNPYRQMGAAAASMGGYLLGLPGYQSGASQVVNPPPAMTDVPYLDTPSPITVPGTTANAPPPQVPPNVGDRRMVNGQMAVWDGKGWKAA